MTFRRTKGGRGGGAFFDMTPMIDVVFQLILFFMYTSQFSQVVRSPLDLPKQVGDDTELINPTAIIVDVQADGTLIVERTVIDLSRLASMVQVEIERLDGDVSRVDLLVRADQTCPARYINRIAEQLAGMGVRNWQLGTAASRQP